MPCAFFRLAQFWHTEASWRPSESEATATTYRSEGVGNPSQEPLTGWQPPSPGFPRSKGKIERHLYIQGSGLEKITLLELLERYEKQINPSHKGQQAERYRLETLKKRLGSVRLIHLSPKEIASYRDIRLKEVSPSSLKRELTILSRVLTIASRDWGISIPQNPVKMNLLTES